MPLQRLMLLIAVLLTSASVSAGELSREQILQRVLPPFTLGTPTDDMPIWPVLHALEPDAGPVGYVFETIDFAALPGFEGRPMNMLVWLDRSARFVSVEVISQHEPVFLSGLGPTAFDRFVAQYADTSLLDRFTVTSPYTRAKRAAREGQVVLDGVTKATASVRIANQTVLSAALAVARAKLGFAAEREAVVPATPRMEVFTRLDLNTLLSEGHVREVVLRNSEVETLFAGTPGAGLDPVASSDPEAEFGRFYLAYLNAPTVGRSLLGDEDYARAMRRARDGQHLYWMASAGRYRLLDEDFILGTVPSGLALHQEGLSLELRDADADLRHRPIDGLNQQGVFSVQAGAGLDPAAPVRLSLMLSRERGQIFPERIEASHPVDYQLPQALFSYPPPPPPAWWRSWQERGPDLAVTGLALTLLTLVLARPRWVAIDARRLGGFRALFLAFTLVFLGWYAQAQVSIVHLTGAIKTLAAGQSLEAFLYDPVTLLVLAFTLLTLLIWGRGTFCGWLCPFGALQEAVGWLAKRLKLRQITLPTTLASVLDRGRYLILAVLLLSAWLAPTLSSRWVEIEPFKTAITVAFDRSWPFVLYALVLLLAGAFLYKFFCRYLCPLGAALALGGRLRIFDWLPRRAECGTPCQTCHKRCEYDAIARSGEIRYADCFQCLDCVGIYHDDQRCAPLIFHRRKGVQGRSPFQTSAL